MTVTPEQLAKEMRAAALHSGHTENDVMVLRDWANRLDDLRAQLTASEQARARAEQEQDESTERLAVLQRSMGLCPEHEPDVWEGDETCVVCEGNALLTRATAAESSLASLRTACEAFVAKWALVLPGINSAFLMQHIHGGHYNGPTIDVEIAGIMTALALLAAPRTDETTP